MVDQGQYDGEVVAQKFSTTKNGHPQFEILCRVKDMIDNNGNELQRTIFYALVTDKNAEILADDLERVFGFVPERWSDLDPQTPGYLKLSGEVALWCKHETYQDKLKEKWRFSNPDMAASKPPEPDQMAKLDAMFGAALNGKKKPPAGAVVRQAAPKTNNDAEIPF